MAGGWKVFFWDKINKWKIMKFIVEGKKRYKKLIYIVNCKFKGLKFKFMLLRLVW